MTSTTAARVMPAQAITLEPAPVMAEDMQVWRGKDGRLCVQFRSAGLAMRAELEPHQADALAGAVLEVAPVPYEPVDAAELEALPTPPAEWFGEQRCFTLDGPSDEQLQWWNEANDHASDVEGW